MTTFEFPGHIPPLAPGITFAATPIGTLADASFRLVSALEQADIIAAEDTRALRRLAAGLGVEVKAPVVAYHEHNERSVGSELVEAAARGECVVVVSDAGMPTISDPGYPLATAAHAAGVPVTVLPGPSAPATALALAGLPTDTFTFYGFLPRKGRARADRLAALAASSHTGVLFESPHRLAATLTDLVQACGGDRAAAVCRELTKVHEQVRRGSLRELADWAQAGVRGEIAVVVGPPIPDDAATAAVTELVAQVEELTDLGLKPKVAVKYVAERGGANARELYAACQQARKPR